MGDNSIGYTRKRRRVSPLNTKMTLMMLGFVILVTIPLLLSSLVSTTQVSREGQAAACRTNECSTSSGCQLRGYRQDGYVCVGSNQWQSPDGQQAAGGPQGPIISPPDQTNLPTIPPQAAPANNLETAKKVLAWIDTMRDAQGVYQSGECRENPGCFQTHKDPKVAHYAMWARYQAFKNTGDQNQLSQLGADLSTFTGLYNLPGSTISYLNNFLVCSLLYPIAVDNSIPAGESSSLQDLCRRSMIIGNVIDEADTQISNNIGIQEPQVDKVLRGEQLALDPNTDSENYYSGFFQYSVYASDLSTQFLWFNDAKQLQRAKHSFNKGLQVYSKQKNSQMLKKLGDSILVLAAADLYAATKDAKYQNFISKFISEKQSNPCQTTKDCAYYLLMLEKMYSLTNNQIYRQHSTDIINTLMDKAYDSNVGAFHEMIPGMKIFDSRANSIISGIQFSLR